jgi:hypothetical protein
LLPTFSEYFGKIKEIYKTEWFAEEKMKKIISRAFAIAKVFVF